MKRYNVSGMSCAACQARVEKAVSAVDGVSSCCVSLVTNSMTVEGNASDEAIVSAVEKAGYSVQAARKNDSTADEKTKAELITIKKKLGLSLVLLAVLMYFSMGDMLGLPVPQTANNGRLTGEIIQLILSLSVMIINRRFFVSGVKGALHGAPNMDTLVALGSSAAFLKSTYTLIFASGKGGYLYFESSAMILTLITVGKLLEAKSKGETADALHSLIKLAPKTAVVERNGIQTELDIDSVVESDTVIVRPAQSIPVDAVITEGDTAVNEAALTGESIPVDKGIGDTVRAGTLNQSGYIKCRVLRVGEDTVLSQIIKTVNDAVATKAPIAKTADRVSGVFVPAVTAIAALTLIVWLLLDRGFAFALERAISVLVISCPCALGLATPVAITVGSGVGAKNGILFRTAVSLEQTGKTQIAVFDKTGTVTKGEPVVVYMIAFDGTSEKKLLNIAYSAEVKSEHPIARAVVKYGEERKAELTDAENFRILPGNGLTCTISGDVIFAGSESFILRNSEAEPKQLQMIKEISESGKTPVLFSKNGRLLGMLAVFDTIREESADAVKELKSMGIRTVLLTGDNKTAAAAVGKAVGIDLVVSEVMPDEKKTVVDMLSALGKTAMIGDGINDAPALTAADTGIAVGNGTDVALECADVVLMKSRLTDVSAAVRLSRQTLKNIRENLFWAFFYNVIGIPLAAGCFVGAFGWQLSPVFAAATMSISSFCVVSNALRLNLFKINSVKKDGKNKKTVPDEALRTVIEQINTERNKKKMKKTAKIEGMMCPHCEARVKKTLEQLDGVVSAQVSFQTGTAVIEGDVDEKALISAVEQQGYRVLSVQ